ncbi:unnamed protein product, partial [Ectocarpus sp. 12 AP-2014]
MPVVSPCDDVDLINNHVMGTGRRADSLFDARVIAFRNKVNTVLTVPMMRTWCKANGTTLFIAPAHDVYVGHQRPGAVAEVPPTDAPWPAGLRREIMSLDDGKTNDLPTSACLAIGAPVVLHKSPQFVLLGVCNNSDGIIRGIELDPREDYHTSTTGYSVVTLRYAPLRVFVYIKSADDAGLHLDGLQRGVIAVAPVERKFTIVGINKRKFTFKRRQIPLTAGCLSSVYRSQGQTMRKIILDIRRPPGHAMDCAAVYVALSRATGLDDLNLLFPVTLQDLNQPQNPDIIAVVKYLHRLDDATMELFLKDPGSFTPAYATLDDIGEAGPRPPKKQPRQPGRHGSGATRRVAHLIPNAYNNCFFNSALTLALAAWDGQPLPDAAAGTPAAGSFFAVLQLLRDSMFDECALSPNIVVQAQQARQAIFSNTSLPGAGSQMGDVASVFEAIAARCPQEGSPIWPDNFNDQQNRVVRTRREFGLDWRYANSCPVSNHSNLDITPDQTAALRNATVITIPNGTATTFHHKVQEFFSSGQASDLSIPGTSLCPFCAAGLGQTLCDWTLLPWTDHTAPSRVFFRSPEVFRGLHGRPMSPSPTLSMGAAYSLVGVSYHIAIGGSRKNHFVTQLRVRGRWHKYDCLAGGAVLSSDAFDADWNSSSQCLLAYLKTSLCVATPPLYTRHEQQHHHDSPSGRQPDHRHHADHSSPSGRNHQRRSQHSPQSPSGRSTSLCGDGSLNDRTSTDGCRRCRLSFVWRHLYQPIRPNF